MPERDRYMAVHLFVHLFAVFVMYKIFVHLFVHAGEYISFLLNIKKEGRTRAPCAACAARRMEGGCHVCVCVFYGPCLLRRLHGQGAAHLGCCGAGRRK